MNGLTAGCKEEVLLQSLCRLLSSLQLAWPKHLIHGSNIEDGSLPKAWTADHACCLLVGSMWQAHQGEACKLRWLT